MWTQIVGKIRMARTPAVNHWWHTTLYVTSRGLTTSPIPDGGRTFQIDFDFIDHKLEIAASDGRTESFALSPCSVADFYKEIMGRLRALGTEVEIWTMPTEIPDPIPFEKDFAHASYDAEAVNRFWHALIIVDGLMKEFRGRFTGKCSPVHFFWGSFDLAVTRFSGRKAPPHPSAPNMADSVTQEAYSDEVSSCGFWPGNGGFGQPAFYAYAYPTPPGFAAWKIQPREASYNKDLGEFILPYESARVSINPDQAVLHFLQGSYEAAAVSAKWDRDGLECKAT
jgi:hypothetical protein